MKTSEMQNRLDGINDSSDITEENISELEGIAKKTIQNENREKKQCTKKKSVASLSYETISRDLTYG